MFEEKQERADKCELITVLRGPEIRPSHVTGLHVNQGWPTFHTLDSALFSHLTDSLDADFGEWLG